MAGQAHRGLRRIVLEDGLQVAQVLGEEIGSVEPLGWPETPPVRGDDVPFPARASTVNWKAAETSIQPWSRKRVGGGGRPAPDMKADAGQSEKSGTAGEGHGGAQ